MIVSHQFSLVDIVTSRYSPFFFFFYTDTCVGMLFLSSFRLTWLLDETDRERNNESGDWKLPCTKISLCWFKNIRTKRENNWSDEWWMLCTFSWFSFDIQKMSPKAKYPLYRSIIRSKLLIWIFSFVCNIFKRRRMSSFYSYLHHLDRISDHLLWTGKPKFSADRNNTGRKSSI